MIRQMTPLMLILFVALTGCIAPNVKLFSDSTDPLREFELHGTARYIACLDCGERYDADPLVRQFLDDDEIPKCQHCGGRLKHATISFGQPLDSEVLERALRLAREADLFLAMGSSLVVEPAASLPRLAKQRGARLVIINRDPTQQDPLADLVIHASIGETLTAIDACLPA